MDSIPPHHTLKPTYIISWHLQTYLRESYCVQSVLQLVTNNSDNDDDEDENNDAAAADDDDGGGGSDNEYDDAAVSI